MASASSDGDVQSGTGSRAECFARTRRPELVSLAWGWLLVHFLERDARNSREAIPPVVIFHAVGEEASGIGQKSVDSGKLPNGCTLSLPLPRHTASRCPNVESPANPSLPVELVPATNLFDGRWLEARDSVTADLGSSSVRFGGNPRLVCATTPGVPQSGKSLGLYAHTVCLVRDEWQEVLSQRRP